VNEKEREKYLRAGLIAATIVNVNRRPGAPHVQPSDFLVEPKRPEDYMGVQEGMAFMDQWAKATNEKAEANLPPAGWEGNGL
jgi:hypothetical protein